MLYGCSLGSSKNIVKHWNPDSSSPRFQTVLSVQKLIASLDHFIYKFIYIYNGLGFFGPFFANWAFGFRTSFKIQTCWNPDNNYLYKIRTSLVFGVLLYLVMGCLMEEGKAEGPTDGLMENAFLLTAERTCIYSSKSWMSFYLGPSANKKTYIHVHVKRSCGRFTIH